MSEPLAIFSTRTLIGAQVQNAQGEDMGQVEELVIDTHSGVIMYAVLLLKSLRGLVEKRFAIPWQALEVKDDSMIVLIKMDEHEGEMVPVNHA